MFTNDQKILIKNRHVDRENDVIIKFKLSQNKIIEELQQLFEIKTSIKQIIEDQKKEENILKIDILNNIFNNFKA